MISDDADNRRRAEADGLKALSVRQYVEGLKDSSAALLDLLAATGAVFDDEASSGKKGPKKAVYDEVSCSPFSLPHLCHLTRSLSQYISSATLLAGIKAGKLHKGHFNANPYNYLEVCPPFVLALRQRCLTLRPRLQGTVNTPTYDRPILLVGRESMNRSVHSDVVVVEVFDESEWKAPGESVVDQDGPLLSFSPSSPAFLY